MVEYPLEKIAAFERAWKAWDTLPSDRKNELLVCKIPDVIACFEAADVFFSLADLGGVSVDAIVGELFAIARPTLERKYLPPPKPEKEPVRDYNVDEGKLSTVIWQLKRLRKRRGLPFVQVCRAKCYYEDGRRLFICDSKGTKIARYLVLNSGSVTLSSMY